MLEANKMEDDAKDMKRRLGVVSFVHLFSIQMSDSLMKSQLMSVVHRGDRNRVLDLLCENSGMLRVGFSLSIVAAELSSRI